MAFKKIRVMIVDDSIFFQTALKAAIGDDPYIDIVAIASSVDEADEMIKKIDIDVITLDVEMPGKKGTELLTKLMPVKKIPVVLVSSLDIDVFKALELGAIDFVKKPDMSRENEYRSFINELLVKIKIATAANVRSIQLATPVVTPILKTDSKIDEIIAIGASTGGTEAILEILRQFPRDFPPVLITQHMPAGFTKMYAERLDKICKIRVAEAKDRMRLENGLAIIAAGDFHMTLKKDANGYYINSRMGEKVSGHCPSVDVLFESVANIAQKQSIGIILTGMGKDGAQGLLSMRKKGAYTIGQDKETSVVYGMPMVAYNIGAVKKQLPLQDIPGFVINQLNLNNKKRG